MHLIAPLAAGIRGAESGSVQVYRRGTSTEATCYSDFEGASLAVDASYTLDANGRAILYVNELVTVVVADTAGSTVTTFTAGESAAAIEYRGQSFTGTHYTTGASAVGNPTTVQSIFDAWYTSAGTTNFNVLVNGASRTLQSVVGSFGGVMFNVKDPAYGAVGDGATNDTAAVAAAVAAASDGGIVYFPPGEYKITGVTIGSEVSLVGASPRVCYLVGSSANTAVVTVEGTDSEAYGTQIMGLAVIHDATTPTAAKIKVIENARVQVLNCRFHEPDEPAAIDVSAATSGAVVRVADSYFECSAVSASRTIDCSGSHNRVSVEGCRFLFADTSIDSVAIYGTKVDVRDCYFDLPLLQGGVGGGAYCYQPSSTTFDATVVDCVFVDQFGDAAGVIAFNLGSYNIASQLVESGNRFAPTMVAYSYTSPTATPTSGGYVSLQSREHRISHTTSANTTVTLNSSNYGVIRVDKTSTTALTISAPVGPRGSGLTIMVYNSSGGATGTVTLSTTDFDGGGSGAAIDAGKLSVYHCRATMVGSDLRWVVVSLRENVT